MAKDAYEISLWHDIFVAPSGNIPGHYEEEKIAVIGSEKMTSQCRALEPKLVCNVNGKITFTFKMFYRYTDELTGEDYDNPFLKLLVNERKVKVYWLKKWYDLVIKNIQESSNGKSIVYTCEDANIYELGRTGFDLIFDDDLSVNNIDGGNQGTAQQLVERTLEGTDWVLGECDVIHQYTEEAVYEVELTRNLAVYDMIENQALSIPATINGQATKILIYYPQLADFINNNTSGSVNINPFYIAYDPTQKYSRLARTEMLVQAKCYAYGSTGVSVCQCTLSGNTLTFSSTNPEYGVFGSADITQVSDQYRANRLVRQPTTKIEPVTGKSCYVYVANENGTGHYAGKVAKGDIIYESIGSEFGDALYATNLIANGKNFTSTAGWESPEPLQLVVYPITTALTEDRIVYLHLPPTTNESRVYYNDAIRANSQHFKDGCKQGEIFRLRIKAKAGISGSYCTAGGLMLTPSVQQWDHQNTQCKQPKNGGKSYFSVSSPQAESGNTGWIYFDLTCIESFTGSDIYKDYIGLFLTQQPSATAGRHIEEIQFFKVVKDDQGNIILPEALETSGIIKTTYTYFKIVDGEIQYLYKGTEDWNKTGVNLTQEYNEGYSKIRSINIKQSNRFNILQTIAETFECWIRFWVPHDETGRLIYHNGIPEKTVTIRQEMGEERGIGFVYGIDLQSIQRTLESTQIVTKTIVLENNNKYGKNGTCRISRSNFNYPQTDYVLNFDYYINHQLMNGRELNADLYGYGGSPTTTRGFYADLHKWNSEYLKLSEENAQYEIALTKNEGLKTVYQNGIDAAIAEINDNKNWVVNMAAAKKYNSTVVRNYIAEYIDTYDELKAHVAAIEAQTKLSVYYEEQVAKLDQVIDTYNRTINSNKNRIKTLLRYIKQKTDLFNKKYSRFISEGSWIDQKYSDDNLYYVDGNSVAYTSSRPKVSYNIAVLRVTGIEGFELKDFQLGDISYIEDTDFFGYTYIQHGNEQVKTPYREKVVITEVTYNFDEPKKDTFKVQNYRTQFEDLFQRIAAQTQSLQYTVGAYNKVSDIIETDGTIKGGTIKSSIDLNNDALNRTSLNNLVTTDERGVTVQSLVNPSQAVRITAGGLFITTNGGDSWNNAIRGDGIGTQFLSSGSINTRDIQIINGDNEFDEAAVAFKWNIEGITAYDSFSTESSVDLAYDKGKYVRFNNEGISIQTRAGSAITSPSYEKLKMGRLNEQNEYGLRINTYNNGATETAFQATESGLFVKGNISATSLTIGDGVTLPAENVADQSGKTLFQIIDGEISSEVSLVNLLPSVYTSEANYGNLRTSNGITWTVNSDGSVTANGTATADSWYTFAGSTTTADIPSITLDPNKQYTISGCPAGGSSSKYSFQAAFYTENQTPSSGNSGATWALDYGNGATTSAGYKWANVYAVVRSGVTVSNKVFYPMLNYGTKVQPYLSTHNGTYQLSSKITQTADQIQSVANRTTEVEGRISTAETRITQTANDITLVAESNVNLNLLPSVYYRESVSGNTWTSNGITWTVNPDGSLTANGTATNTVHYYLNNFTGNIGPIRLDPTKKYRLHGAPDGAGTNTWRLAGRFYTASQDPTNSSGGTYYSDTGSGVTIPTGFTYAVIYSARIESGQKVTNKTWYPMLEAGTIDHAYMSTHNGSYAMSASIQVNAASINSEVTARTALASRVSTAESSIIQTANSITSVVARTSVLESKGNNLLRNSGTFEGWGMSEGVTLKTAGGTAVGGNTYANFPAVTTVEWRSIYHNTKKLAIPYSQIRNKTITVSVYVSSADATKITGETKNYLSWRLNLRTNSSSARTKYVSLGSIYYGSSTRNLTTSWTRVSRTIEVNDSIFTEGEGTISSSDYVYLSLVNYSPYSGRFCCPQIEIGEVATPWGPMIGDNSLQVAESEISQTAEEISLKVSSSEYTADNVVKKVNASSITINPDRISLKGKTINLTSDTINISSTNFNVSSTGAISAYAGVIGKGTNKINIGTNATNAAIYNGVTSLSDTAHTGFYLGADGFVLGKGVFKVTSDGKVAATSGTIGNWTVDATHFKSPEASISGSTYYAGLQAKTGATSANRAFYIAKTTDGTTTYPFSVFYNGNVSLTGEIKATSGQIGKVQLSGNSNNNYLYIGSGSTMCGMGSSTRAFWAGGSNAESAPFSVAYDGTLTATKFVVAAGQISGKLTANQINGTGLVITDSGTIGPFSIGKEGSVPILSATNVKLTSTGVYTSNGYFSQIGGYGTAQGANNIKLVLSDGTTPTLEAYIRAVALNVIASNVTKTVYRNTNATVQTLYANDGDNRVLYGYIR